jgi:hypothetical protein
VTAKTAAGRKADERLRHKDAGRVAVTVYVRPEFREDVRALEAKLQRRETQRSPAQFRPELRENLEMR